MKKREVEIFDESVNCPVIRFPGRKFPGVLIQGDSLKQLLIMMTELSALSLKGSDQNEIQHLAGEAKEILAGYLKNYERTLKDNNISLPY